LCLNGTSGILDGVTLAHRLVAVSVAIIWGLNFIAIDASLAQFPPFFLVALRFGLIAVPTLLFVPWPRVPVRWLLLYGAGFGTLQFLFLYWGMAAGMPVGLASLVLQCSAPFTVALGAVFLRERLSAPQVVGIVVAVGGLGLVGQQRWESAALLPFLLTIAGGLGWALGNLGNRLAAAANPLRLVLWMSVVPPLPMLAVALWVEGPERIVRSLTTVNTSTGWAAVAGLAYTIVLGTVAGSGLWTYLMARHPASRVAPFSLLVPVVGLTAAAALLGERPTPVELAGSALVVAGVLYGGSRARRAVPQPLPARSG
jgi:O-acetylserine/cysteine efflux transporter